MISKDMECIAKIGRVVVAVIVTLGLFGISPAIAARVTSPNYQIDVNLDGSFGGATESGNYKMTSTGGESIVGNGASGSYKLTPGEVDSASPYLLLSIPDENVAFGSVTSGTSLVEDFSVNAETNATDYSLSIDQNHDLQTGDASASIPSAPGTTVTPLSWVEGTTTGLGYSIAAAPLLLSKWSAGTKFAAIPNSATTFYDGEGGAPDTITMRLRLDVTEQQKASDYTNLITISGTMTP